MEKKIKILFVEDSKTDVELIHIELEKSKINYTGKIVGTKEEYLEALDSFNPDLILSDYSLPQFDGMNALNIRNESAISTPFILVTGSVNEEVAVECMKAGAEDYILKQNLSRLGLAIKSAIKKKEIVSLNSIAQEELKMSEFRLQRAQSIAQVGNWELDLSSKTMWASEESFRIYGIENTESVVPYEFIKDIPLEEYRPLLDNALDNLLKYNEPYDVEYRIRRKNDNSVRFIHTRAELIKSQNDVQVKVVGVIQDITERKKIEEKIIESEAYYRTLVELSPDGILISDMEGKVSYASKKTYEVFGIPSGSEVLGTSILDWVSPDYKQIVIERVKEILAGNISPEIREYKLLKYDRTPFWAELSSSPIPDLKSNPGGLLMICRDVTERKNVEDELIRAKEKAEVSDRLKTAFLHNVSHEIRTPMNAIIGFATLLQEPGVDFNSQQSYVELIMQSSNHLLSIISDIVDISNVEANSVKITRNEINLNETINSVCRVLSSKLNVKDISLTCENDMEDSKSLIITDGTKIVQILTNLVSNACKFTFKGQIKVNYKVKNNFLEFCVSDTGVGISPENQSKIFERFYQVQSSASRVFEGMGLGLSISKAYVELLGGKIWLTSEPGIGSSFYFTVPYVKPVSAETDLPKEKASVDFAFAKKKRILVAEDDDNNFKLIKYFLSDMNADMVRALNGKEAVDLASSSEKFDLILMDIKMPVMDGYEASRIIRKSNPGIPIIAQTAYADDRIKAISAGCTGFLSKPFDKMSLIKYIREFI